MSLLSVKHLTKNFGGLCAVSNVSMEINEHELIGLIGPNGAGKTTLFNLLTGVYEPSEGSIELNVDGKMTEIGGMKPYFDYFFISEHAGAAKPAPAFFDYAFRELNENRSVPILPQETLIIGDSLSSDIAGGLQYGMKTCYYRRPGAPAAPTGVDDTVTDLRQIPALF